MRTSTADATTRITVSAPQCPECHVRLVQAKIGEYSSWYSHSQQIGQDGFANFHVPVARTRGMSFQMSSSFEGDTGAGGDVVVRYAKIPKGSTVGEDEATDQSRGSACWYGTTKPAITVQISTTYVVAQGYQGEDEPMLVSWMSPQHRIAGPMVDLQQGAFRAQDDAFC